jgi:HAD domain in Swiss Army Knife RNA repair proteins
MTPLKPYLLLDVDGVLNPIGGGPPPGYTRQETNGFQVTWSIRHREWLKNLSSYFEMVWATTWEHLANESIGPLLDLPKLAVIEFTSPRHGDTWKLTDVKRFVGERACAWVDDALFGDAQRWADDRDAPTLILRPSPSVGLTEAHASDLEFFGRSLAEDAGSGRPLGDHH